MRYIHDRFPLSEPASAPREPPRCEFEEFFSTSEVASSVKPILILYPRVDEILDSCADRAARFAKESKPLYRVLPFKCKATPVGDRPDFCVSRYVNSDFSRIARQKTILRSRASSMTLSDLDVSSAEIRPGFSIFNSRSVAEFLAVIIFASTAQG